MRGDNFPIVDLSKYHTEGKEAHYIQFNHIVNHLTTNNKNITEDRIKIAEYDSMLHLKTLGSKTATYLEMTRVSSSMRREDRYTAPEGYKPIFEKLSIWWGLSIVDDQIPIPFDKRRTKTIFGRVITF